MNFFFTGTDADKIWKRILPYLKHYNDVYDSSGWRNYLNNKFTIEIKRSTNLSQDEHFKHSLFHALLHFGEENIQSVRNTSRADYFSDLMKANSNILKATELDPYNIFLIDGFPDPRNKLNNFNPNCGQGYVQIILNKIDGYTSVIPLSKDGVEEYWECNRQETRKTEAVSQFKFTNKHILTPNAIFITSKGIEERHIYIQAAARVFALNRPGAYNHNIFRARSERKHNDKDSVKLLNHILKHILLHIDYSKSNIDTYFYFEEYNHEAIKLMLSHLGIEFGSLKKCKSREGHNLFRYIMPKGGNLDRLLMQMYKDDFVPLNALSSTTVTSPSEKRSWLSWLFSFGR